MKKRIFISHIHEERALGAVVSEWVTDAFAGQPAQTFLSSDNQSIQAGQKWLDVVQHELSGTAVMISLLSPTSLARPWVNIELGAAWITNVRIIPLCHSGLTVAALPRPFSDFTAVSLAQDDAANRLLAGVSDGLQFPHSKKLHFEKCLAEMRAAAVNTHATQAVAVVATERPPEQIAILKMLATFGNRNGAEEYVDGPEAPRMCGIAPVVFKYHSEQLKAVGLIHTGYWGDGPHYRITGSGAGWLMERGLMPD
jgi:hypothetical protein